MEDSITQSLVTMQHSEHFHQDPSMIVADETHDVTTQSPPESEEHFVVVNNLIDQKPIRALVLLSKSIARCRIPDFPQHSNFKSAIETVDVLAYVFRRIQFSMKPEEDTASILPKPALRCFQKLFEVLCRIRSLLESCSGGSRIATLLLSDVVPLEFCDLAEELHDRLKPFPWELFDSAAHRPELKNLMDYIMGKCATHKVHIDRTDMELRGEVETEVEAIERERHTFPDYGRVAKLFERLGVVAVEAQVSEVMMLESEIRTRKELHSKRPGLEELVRYCKFVFLGGFWPEGPVNQRNPRSDWVLPPKFRCPITGAVMRDPVTVSSGQTYERFNIERWLRVGHRLCPVTHRRLVQDDVAIATNQEVQRQINEWVEEHGINQKLSEEITPRMVASYVAERLASQASPEATNKVLSMVTARARSDAKLAVQMGEAGAIPLLLRHLRADDPALRANSMATLHALSSLGANKARIMEEEHGAGVNAIIDLLNEGPTWEARGHAAGTLYQLSTVRPYHWCLAREARVVEGLVRVAREAPPARARGEGLVGVLGLGSDRMRLEEVRLLLGQCRGGEVEAVARVVAVGPALWLVKNLRDTSTAWKKRKLRRAAAALLDACMEWVWRWGAFADPLLPDKDK